MNKSIFALLTLFFLCAQTHAATLQVALPGLIGTYNYQSATSRAAPFDLGVRFAAIDSVTLTVSGSGSAGSYRVCDDFLPPFECGPILLLAPEGVFWVPFNEVGGPFARGTIGPFETDVATLIQPLLAAPGGTLDFLLDGAAQINMTINTLGCGFCTLEFFGFPTFTIQSATLTVRGTLVPLPGALVCLASALLTLAGRRFVTRVLAHSGRRGFT